MSTPAHHDAPTILGGDHRVAVVVTLGTDHHPFGRLVEWVDRWAEAHPDAPCVVQHGTAPPPRFAEGHAFVDPAAIPALLARSSVAVGHAGPGTILDARRAGRLPVVVPRRHALGEVVDDHQVTFGRWMADRRQAICVENEADLHAHLSAAWNDPSTYALAAGDGATPFAVTLLGELIDGMLHR